MKTDVCGERGALQEWRAALERSSGDITAIEQFTKQDLSKAKVIQILNHKKNARAMQRFAVSLLCVVALFKITLFIIRISKSQLSESSGMALVKSLLIYCHAILYYII